ncbi:hypothetical protein ACFX15_034582 [Malus domestica]
MPVMEDIGMYLGVITVWGRSKYDALTYIKDRVLAKIMGWKQQFISQVGKKVLIKAIDMVVPTYPMNVFQLPDRLCREIDVVFAKFWWGNTNKERNGAHQEGWWFELL